MMAYLPWIWNRWLGDDGFLNGKDGKWMDHAWI
jgi:hypothetical protein